MPVVAALLLLGQDATKGPSGPSGVIGSGPGRACAVASARAQVRAQAPVRGTARVVVPLTVTEQATGKHGTIVVSRSESIVEQASASRLVSVRQLSVARARACARGSTTDAAHGVAFRRSYGIALQQARRRAAAAARARVKALAAQLAPAELASARRSAQARATAAAGPARQALAAQVLAAARRRAG